MPQLMITCPNSDTPVATGITASRAALKETDSYATEYYIDKYNMLMECSACGETHVWHADDAFFEREAEDGDG